MTVLLLNLESEDSNHQIQHLSTAQLPNCRLEIQYREATLDILDLLKYLNKYCKNLLSPVCLCWFLLLWISFSCLVSNLQFMTMHVYFDITWSTFKTTWTIHLLGEAMLKDDNYGTSAFKSNSYERYSELSFHFVPWKGILCPYRSYTEIRK